MKTIAIFEFAFAQEKSLEIKIEFKTGILSMLRTCNQQLFWICLQLITTDL